MQFINIILLLAKLFLYDLGDSVKVSIFVKIRTVYDR